MMETTKIELPFTAKKAVLALGTQTKNTVCFLKGRWAYISAARRDVDSPEEYADFTKSVRYFLTKKPRVIAHDLHPEYVSTKYALTLQPPGAYALRPVQHHHAHIASCMAENGLKNSRVIGVAFDGTGLGTDGTLWGGEFLVCDYKDFRRAAHLKALPLLGGERAVLEPWRLALTWLSWAYKERLFRVRIDFLKGIDKQKWRVLQNMRLAQFNTPLSSSMGRLFDAVASIVLVKHKAQHEAALAMELEKAASASLRNAKHYHFEVLTDNDTLILDPLPIFSQIVREIRAKKPPAEIAYAFHSTVAQMIRRICLVLAAKAKTKTVVLSGGVFQNSLLLRLSSEVLCKEGFRVITHRLLSANDSGVSLGQAAVASFS